MDAVSFARTLAKVVLCSAMFVGACESDEDDGVVRDVDSGHDEHAPHDASIGDSDGGDAAIDEPVRDTKYVVGSVVFGPESQTTYINVLDSLEPQTVDYGQAIELPGWGDLWAHEGFLYVTDGESPIVTKYAITEGGELEEEATISFATYGEVDAAFWSNTFVAPDKAYMIDGVGGYVIWDPLAMEITGTFDLPQLPEHEPFLLRAGTLDRANVIVGGKLYQPMYWSDADWAVFAPDSVIVVIDIATDSVDQVIDVPCSGLDIGTADDEGNLYYSTWTGGVYQPLVLGDPGNCIAKLVAGEGEASNAFTFADIADGREGAAVRHFRDGKLLLSVFHDERFDFADYEDPWEPIAEPNWRTWLYDPETESASLVESLDWNSGATYVHAVDGLHYVMVPDANYEATTVVALDENLDARDVLELNGWGMRLFRVR
jgi:hypothetical protein